MAYVVAIYLVDRAYGGPEEGGWYYDFGEPSNDHCQYTKGFDTEPFADSYANHLDETVCKELNIGRRSINSVLSQGQYQAIVSEGNPTSFPKEKPQYE